MFEKIATAPADPILGLTDEFKKDPRDHKINLGVGIYKNEQGRNPSSNFSKKSRSYLT